MMSERATQATTAQEVFLDDMAEAICRHGLRLPALITLHIGHPFTFLGAQLLWVAQPALSLWLSPDTTRRLGELLEEPTAVTALLTRLEAREG